MLFKALLPHGGENVYTVKGYDKDFLLMLYDVHQGAEVFRLYEKLNDLTIYSGEDVFGKLNMVNRVSSANYQSSTSWRNEWDDLHKVEDIDIVNKFLEELNHTKPITDLSLTYDNSKILTLNLNDGLKVSMHLFKEGYVSYLGVQFVYFKMDQEVFDDMWDQFEN